MLSSQFEAEPGDNQQQIRNLAKLRHIQELHDIILPLPKWRRVASIPQDTAWCLPVIAKDTLYIRVARGTPLRVEFLSTSLTGINEQSKWTRFHIDLPPSGHKKPWIHQFQFSSSVTNVLYVYASNDPTSEPYTVFMLENSRWTKIAHLPSVRERAAFAVHHNYLIVAGGHNGNGIPVLDVIFLNLLANNELPVWHTVGELPEYRASPHILLDNEHAHIIGGSGWFRGGMTSIVTLTLDKDLDPDTYSEGSYYTVRHGFLPPAPYSLPAAAMVNDKILLFGGWQPNEPESDVGRAVNDVYFLHADGGEKKWLPLPSLSSPMSMPYLFHSDDKLYRISGNVKDDIRSAAEFEISRSIEVLEW